MTSARKQHWPVTRAWQTNTALLVIGFALLLFTRQLVSEFSHFTIGYSGCAGWSVILYLLAALLILTQPVNRATFAIILAIAILCRLVVMMPDPAMSSDIYRYAWDGAVQHAHISPYRYVPGDSALKFLRAPNQDLFDNINRRDSAHTIYPPAAQMLFYLITFISPMMTFMKLAMILFEGITLWGLVHLLRELGIRREQSLLYAWCPLLIWEIGSSGHLDSAVMAFIVLALLSRIRNRPSLTGLYLAIAVLIKFYPLILFPALYKRGDRKMPLVMVVVAVLSYSFYINVGMRVFGFLSGYAEEEGLDSGRRFFLLNLVRHVPGLDSMPTSVFIGFTAVVMGALAVWCWHGNESSRQVSGLAGAMGLTRDTEWVAGAMALAFTMMLLFSPHYPWYVAWLVPFFVLIPNLPLLAYFCGLFYLCATSLGAGTVDSEYSLNCILYAGVIVAVFVEWALRRWPLLLLHRGRHQ